MNASTITEQDIKALQKSQSKVVRLTTLIMIPLLVVLQVMCGVGYLYLCSRFSHRAGMSMFEVIKGWFSGIDVSQTYAGMYLKVLDRWEAGIIELAAAGFIAFLFVVARISGEA